MDDSALQFMMVGVFICALLVVASEPDARLETEYREGGVCMCLRSGPMQ